MEISIGTSHRGRSATSVNVFVGSKKTPSTRENSPIGAESELAAGSASVAIPGDCTPRRKRRKEKYKQTIRNKVVIDCVMTRSRTLMRVVLALPVLFVGLGVAGCDIEDFGGFGRFTKDFHYSYELKPNGRLS